MNKKYNRTTFYEVLSKEAINKKNITLYQLVRQLKVFFNLHSEVSPFFRQDSIEGLSHHTPKTWKLAFHYFLEYYEINLFNDWEIEVHKNGPTLKNYRCSVVEIVRYSFFPNIIKGRYKLPWCVDKTLIDINVLRGYLSSHYPIIFRTIYSGLESDFEKQEFLAERIKRSWLVDHFNNIVSAQYDDVYMPAAQSPHRMFRDSGLGVLTLGAFLYCPDLDIRGYDLKSKQGRMRLGEKVLKASHPEWYCKD